MSNVDSSNLNQNPGLTDIDLRRFTTVQGFSIMGAIAQDYAGRSVSGAGDINGDGINDVIVGAMYASPCGRTRAGMAYVIYGKATGLNSVDLVNLTAEQGFKILGAVAGDVTGIAVGSAGDINGDGMNDVIVGAYSAAPIGRTGAGVVYVIYGRSNGLADIDLSNFTTTQGFKIIGAAAWCSTGVSVSSAGDINGDRISDIIVGAPGASPNGKALAGMAYVIYGKTNGATDIDLLNLTPAQGFKIIGAAPWYSTGVSVSSAGDINGDGINDAIVGADASITNLAGMAYVIYGKTKGFTTDIDLANFTKLQGFKIIGSIAGDRTGASVSNVGDINGDGIDDVIVGAPLSSPSGRIRAGIAYVIYGRTTELNNINLATFTKSQGFKILGVAGGFPGDQTGYSVNTAGDINGDGINDMIVGAPLSSLHGKGTGTAYVIYGKTTVFTDIDLLRVTTSQGFKILGAAGHTGASVNSAGDINGDGINDIIVGAYWSSPNSRVYAGSAYVIYGVPSLSSITVIEICIALAGAGLLAMITSGCCSGHSEVCCFKWGAHSDVIDEGTSLLGSSPLLYDIEQ